jgi:hypothetical protein
MKIRIEADDFVGADGEAIKRGTEFTVSGDTLPADWMGRVVVVDDAPAGAKAITNPKAKG